MTALFPPAVFDAILNRLALAQGLHQNAEHREIRLGQAPTDLTALGRIYTAI